MRQVIELKLIKERRETQCISGERERVKEREGERARKKGREGRKV